MDKNAIKKYAIWARRELIARVSQRAALYEITADGYGNADAVSVHGRILSLEERNQRKALIAQIQQKGFEQVMEEIAYTWFNRFSALRFMEVNGYLPSHVRVFTDEENNFKPQIMTEAIHLEMEGLDLQKVFAYKDANDDDGLFKYLIITQCNALSAILPGMFQKIFDYTELLFPDNLLREGSVVEQMISMIPEEDWTDQVQIIGWLYQYYISEKHEEVVNPLYGKGIKKEDIPAATQLFTPDWIVRYMVDNSLGRYWIENNPNSELRKELKYYIPSKTNQTTNVEINPISISFFDPCLGSGHILAYAFDVFMLIYRECGYTDRDATERILENNLWGLDIDDRAYQLSYFSIMMKARKYNRRIFMKNYDIKIAAIQESNGIPDDPIFKDADSRIKSMGQYLVETFKNAKEIGSLIKVTNIDFLAFEKYLVDYENKIDDLIKQSWQDQIYNKIVLLLKQAKIMAKKYDIVCTNPPYMNNLKGELKKYIYENYKDFSGDLFSAFIVRNLEYALKSGFTAFMTPNVWLYIKSFEKLRYYLIKNNSILSFLLLAKGAFYKEATVDLCSFVLSNQIGKEGNYIRLESYKGDMDQQNYAFLNSKQIVADGNIFFRKMEQFSLIPGHPFAFWISNLMLDTFKEKSVQDYSISKAGIVSGNDNVFLRFWYEIKVQDITFDATDFNNRKAYKWVPINKGGAFRRYYGNNEYVINIYDLWNSPDKVNASVRRSEPEFYFKKAMTWSYVTTGKSSFRFTVNKTSATAAPNLFFNSDEELYYTLAFTNSCITQNYLDLLNPTINLNVTNVSTLPLIIDNSSLNDVVKTCLENINLCKLDWDSFETSWDFIKHPLLTYSCCKSQQNEVHKIAHAFDTWKSIADYRFNKLKLNEEYINKIFIGIYGLSNEVNPIIEDKDVSIRKADLIRDIRSLISYAVGCMFGRYSLDLPGLVFAGGEWDASKYKTFEADTDAIIPICDDEYFNDDIVGRFVNFVEIVYGKETLEENLEFIADALGGNGTSREVIRNYFINSFYADHLKVYQKRPIYWLFDSGKQNGFKCLVYMHRYQPDTIARIRTDYVHEQQSRYRTAMADLQNRIDNADTTSERVKLSKKLKTVREQDEELRIYEEKIHHLADQMIKIDLDDGVKVNYAKFQEVLAKIK